MPQTSRNVTTFMLHLILMLNLQNQTQIGYVWRNLCWNELQLMYMQWCVVLCD